MYSIRNALDQEPVAIAGAIEVTLLALVAGGLLAWTGTVVASVALVVKVWLTLFVRAKSTPTAPLEALAESQR